ncbi:hypothetical protein B0T17DRAFT_243803 [Bombardia bombarda]|uniref:Uncharacterized protein n=1 Tax=Bombardia bombarda TaxID=252184 RepID=A0AA39WZM0_9PEZI|nr:hypothetical protein B0T17DRAFT_243803 [Bombardia bombarda]
MDSSGTSCRGMHVKRDCGNGDLFNARRYGSLTQHSFIRVVPPHHCVFWAAHANEACNRLLFHFGLAHLSSWPLSSHLYTRVGFPIRKVNIKQQLVSATKSQTHKTTIHLQFLLQHFLHMDDDPNSLGRRAILDDHVPAPIQHCPRLALLRPPPTPRRAQCAAIGQPGLHCWDVKLNNTVASFLQAAAAALLQYQHCRPSHHLTKLKECRN